MGPGGPLPVRVRYRTGRYYGLPRLKIRGGQGRAVLADQVPDRLLGSGILLRSTSSIDGLVGLAGDLAHLLEREQHRRCELADEQPSGRGRWVHPGLRLSIPAAALAGSVLDDADLYRRLGGRTRIYQIFRMSGFLLTFEGDRDL